MADEPEPPNDPPGPGPEPVPDPQPATPAVLLYLNARLAAMSATDPDRVCFESVIARLTSAP